MASTTSLLRGLPLGGLGESREPEGGRGWGWRIPESVSSVTKTVVDGSVDAKVRYWSERDGAERYVDMSVFIFVAGDGAWVVVATASSGGIVAVKSGDSWIGDTGKAV